VSKSPDLSFEESLESFLPLSESEQKDFIVRVRRTFRRRGASSFEHIDKPAALELISDAHANRVIHAFERAGNGMIDVVIDIQGHTIEGIERMASREDGARLAHNDHPDNDVQARLRSGDVALFNEFVEHPDRFKEYNPKDGPSWEQSESSD
jgi:hypothetical protein